MTDELLNLAIHTEVEGWQQRGQVYSKPGLFGEMIVEPVNDYCHDPSWCVQMMEEHKTDVAWGEGVGKWTVHCQQSIGHDPSLTRAVALAVLELHRRKTP